jgi:hypothetical protein
MSIQTKFFRRADTGEVKEFRPDSYRIDTTNLRSANREHVDVHFLRATDGTRIDLKKDGSYQEKWGQVWIEESTH